MTPQPLDEDLFGDTLLDAALEYIEHGKSIIPIRNGTKKPLIKWEKYQTEIATPDEVSGWFKLWPDAQIALVTGLISKSAVIDGDSKIGNRWMKKNLPRTSVYQKTPKGYHAIYATNGQPVKNKVRISDGVDVRGDGGYILIAPSRHPSGAMYELIYPIEGEGWDELAEFPYEILNSNTEDNQSSVTLDPVSTGRRNDTLAQIAGKYIGNGMNSDEVLDLCLGWNMRCPEPQTEKDVEATVNSIIKIHEENNGPLDSKNTPKIEILSDVSMGIDEFRTLPIPERKSYLHPWLKEESVVLIAGERGIGKSNCALGILDAVTRGIGFGPWENQCITPCLYFDAEMPRGELQERITKMSVERQTPLHILSSGQFTANGYSAPNLMDEEWRDAFRAFLKEAGVKLWVLDNLASAAAGRDEISKKDYDPLNQWFLTLRHDGITTIVMAHTGYDKTHVRGSSGQEDNVNMSIVLQKPPDYNELDGCRFNLKFTKKRVDTKDLHLCAEYEFKMVERRGLFTWEYRSAATTKIKYILEAIESKIPYKEISLETGVTMSRISQIKSDAINKGWMTAGGKIRQGFYATGGV